MGASPSWIEKRLISRDYARLWYGQAISVVGDNVFTITLVLWIAGTLAKDRAWAPSAVSGLIFVMFGAVFVVGPLAGVYVDRWNRRRTMLRSESIRALLVGILAALAFLPVHALPVGVWLAVTYVLVFLVNAAGQFFGPARNATIADILGDPADRARAAGIGQATSATASIIGPPLAAPLLFSVGIQAAMIINALSYVVSWVAIRSVRQPDASGGKPKAESTLGKEFVAGLRYFGKSRVLVTILACAVICQLGTGAWNTLEYFFVTRTLHTDQKLVGIASMAIGVGVIGGSLISGRVVKRQGARTAYWTSTLLAGVFMLLLSRQTGLPGALVVYVLVAVPMGIINTALSPILMGAAPNDMLGRIFAVFGPVNQLASIISALTGGWLLSSVMRDFHATVGGLHLGPVDTIYTGIGLLFLVSAVYGLIALPRDTGAQQSPGAASSAEPDADPEPVPAG